MRRPRNERLDLVERASDALEHSGRASEPGAPRPRPNQLQLGPLALTRALCPPGSLHDRMARDWGHVRSYILEDGHLFLSLRADGGVYELEPVTPSAPTTPR